MSSFLTSSTAEVTAFLFPGQGSLPSRAGRDIHERWPASRAVFERAAELSGVDVASLCFESNHTHVTRTDNVHLAIFTHSLAVLAVLDEQGIRPDAIAGHSLGEITALVAAEAVTFEEGIRLVQERGRILADCVAAHPGGMLAVRGLSLEQAERLAASLRDQGEIGVANVNGERDVVLSGDWAGMRAAMEVLRALGKPFVPLKVLGGFHSPLMAAAAERFRAVVATTPFRRPRYRLLCAATGELLQDASAIRRHLHQQILLPVRWDLVLRRLGTLGVDVWIELGPDKVLTGLVLRWRRGARAWHTADSSALARILRTCVRSRG